MDTTKDIAKLNEALETIRDVAKAESLGVVVFSLGADAYRQQYGTNDEVEKQLSALLEAQAYHYVRAIRLLQKAQAEVDHRLGLDDIKP